MGCGSSKSLAVEDSAKPSPNTNGTTKTVQRKASDEERPQIEQTTDVTDGLKEDKAETIEMPKAEEVSEPAPVVEQKQEEAYSAPTPPQAEPETTLETEAEIIAETETGTTVEETTKSTTEAEKEPEQDQNNTEPEEPDQPNTNDVSETEDVNPLEPEAVTAAVMVTEPEPESPETEAETPQVETENLPAETENAANESENEPTEAENQPTETETEPTETENQTTENEPEIIACEVAADVSGEVTDTESKESDPSEFNEFELETLKSHNECREKHGVPELTLNKDLSAAAQVYAETLVANGTTEKSAMESRLHNEAEVGENILRGEATINGAEAASKFYSTIEEYNYENPTFSENSCHFTQLIWKSSQQLGVGKAVSEDGDHIVVVCRYFPAGNIDGAFEDNVPLAL